MNANVHPTKVTLRHQGPDTGSFEVTFTEKTGSSITIFLKEAQVDSACRQIEAALQDWRATEERLTEGTTCDL